MTAEARNDFIGRELVCDWEDSMTVSSLGTVSSDENESDDDNDVISTVEKTRAQADYDDEIPARYRQRRQRRRSQGRLVHNDRHARSAHMKTTAHCSAPDLDILKVNRVPLRQERQDDLKANERWTSEFTCSLSGVYADNDKRANSFNDKIRNPLASKSFRKARNMRILERQDSNSNRWAPVSTSGRELRALKERCLRPDDHANYRWSPVPSIKDLTTATNSDNFHVCHDHIPRKPREHKSSVSSVAAGPDIAISYHGNAQWKVYSSAEPKHKLTSTSILSLDIMKERNSQHLSSRPGMSRRKSEGATKHYIGHDVGRSCSRSPRISPDRDGGAACRNTSSLLPEDSPVRGALSRWNSSSSFTYATSFASKSMRSVTSTADWSMQPKLPKRASRKGSRNHNSRSSPVLGAFFSSSSSAQEQREVDKEEATKENSRVVSDSSDSSFDKERESEEKEHDEENEKKHHKAPSLAGIHFPKVDMDAVALMDDKILYASLHSTLVNELKDSSMFKGENSSDSENSVSGSMDVSLEDDFREDNNAKLAMNACNSFHCSIEHCETILEDAADDDVTECPPPSRPPAEGLQAVVSSDHLLRAPKRRKSLASLVALSDESEATTSSWEGQDTVSELGRPTKAALGSDMLHQVRHPPGIKAATCSMCPKQPVRRGSMLLDSSFSSLDSAGSSKLSTKLRKCSVNLPLPKAIQALSNKQSLYYDSRNEKCASPVTSSASLKGQQQQGSYPLVQVDVKQRNNPAA